MPIPYIQMLIGVTVGVLGFLFFKKIQDTSHNEHSGQNYQRYHPPPRQDSPPPRRRYEGQPGDICVICLEQIKEENMRKLSCGHTLHKNCFEEAKKHSKNCPVCRKVML